MAAPTHVQNNSGTFTGVASGGLLLNSVASGNLLVGTLVSKNTARSWTFSDDKGNTWVNDKAFVGTNGRCRISHANNVAIGNTTITATIDLFTGEWNMSVFEVSGQDTSTPLDQTSEIANNSTTDHHCAAASNINTSSNGTFIVGTGITQFTAGTLTKGGSYTLVTSGNMPTGNHSFLTHYRTSSTALTAERGTWTSTTSRTSDCVIASFKAPTAGGGSKVKLFHHHRQQMTKR